MKKRIIGFVPVTCAILVLIWRAFYGFDWSDESYYSAIVYRIIQGDALFQASWDIHQLSALLLVPFFWVYTSIFSTAGIILFSRFLYLFVIIVDSLWLHIKVERKYGVISGALASVLLLSYTGSYGLSYNTMMVEAYVIAILFLPSAHKADNRVRYVLSGLFSGVAVQSYPTTIMVLILIVAYIVLNEKDNRWKMLCYYIAGGLIVLLGFCVFLTINSSFTAMFHNLKYLFMDPEHGEITFSIREHFLQLRNLIDIHTEYTLIIASTLAIATWFTKGKIKSTLGFLSVLSLLLCLYFQWNSIRAEYGKGLIQFQFFFSIALCCPTLWMLDKCRWNNLLFLLLGGAIGSIGVNISTNNDAAFYVYPYLISAIGTLIYANQLTRKYGEKNDRMYIKSMILLPIALIVLYTYISSVVFVYRDGELKNLDTRMTSGPAAGIYTTETRAKQYEETIHAINTYMPKEGNVLYTKLLPFGYLCNDAKPATPRLWRTNLDYPLFEEYYLNNPDKLPDAIYIVNSDYGITNGGTIIGDYMQNYIDSTPHKKLELNCATILLFGSSNDDKN